jgi:hypothetical protein
MKRFVAVLLVLFLSVVAISIIGCGNSKKTDRNASRVSVTDAQRKRVEAILAAVGWQPGSYTLDVDVSKDTSKAGEGSFTAQAVRTPQELVEFFGASSPAAEEIITSVSSTTGDSVEDVRNLGNWVAVQGLAEFTYPGNTSFKDGRITGAGVRKGKAGEIFLLYLPTTATAPPIAVRTACGNPQTVLPRPAGPVPAGPPPPKGELTPKDPSQDPWPRGNAPVAGGPNADPGPGPYVPPEEMEQPPATPRVNPPPPVSPPPNVHEDPAPAPRPEQEAPTPVSPAEDYSPPPG